MKHNYKTSSNSEADPTFSLRRLQLFCGHCYQGVLHRLDAIRARIERQFSGNAQGYEHVLKSAINEAEALAWQTPYPHLFFPELAREKALAVQQWATHQRAIFAREEKQAFAA